MAIGANKLVGVSASLGGLSALRRFLKAIPDAFEAAVAIVQHRGEDAGSRLDGLLRSHTSMPLVEPDHGTPILARHVYLAPSGYHLLADGQEFALNVDAAVNHARPSADVLFESIAESFARRGAVVVLSGSSNDGAAGAAVVAAAGGRVFVQDAEDAESAAAPRAAQALVQDAIVGSIEELAMGVSQWCSHGAEV